MKLSCFKKDLLETLQIAERIISKSFSMPILNNVILEANSDYLKLRATNLDLGFISKIKIKMDKSGQVAISPQILINFLNNISDEEVFMEEINGNLEIISSENKTLIKCFNYDDFPEIIKISENEVKSSLKLSASDLSLGLKSTIFSAAISDIKPEISSVFLFSENKELYFVGTDSFRLAEKKSRTDDDKVLDPVIIPIKNAIEISKILENQNKSILLNLSEEKLEIKSLDSSLYLVSRIINGNYPDYKQIIPNQFKTLVFLNKEEFLRALRISTIFSDKLNQVTLKVNSNHIELFSQNQDIGESKTIINGEVDGGDIEVKFNIKYLIEGLNNINSTKISLNLNESNKPVLLRGDNADFTYLIMPISR